MSRAASHYSIGSPTRTCAATGRALGTGDHYVAALVQPAASDELVRMDFAAEAWDEGRRPPSDLLVFGFWRGVVPEPGAKRRLLIDDASLLDLFEQSEQGVGLVAPEGENADAAADPVRAERDRLAFRFVLALILMRKRLLLCDRNEGGTMHVRPRGTPKPPEGPPLVEVVDPGLDAVTIERVTAQLGFVLSDGGSPAGGAAQP